MSLARASTPALIGLAVFSALGYALAERSLAPVHAEAYAMKRSALRLMERAEAAILAAKQERGIAIDSRNDPGKSGVIGPQFSLITTDRGAQSAKQLAAHPNFAALVTQLLLRGGVRKGDLVAVGMTGSLPGLNLAVYSACQAIGAEPIVISSVGASMFGATDPDMTWLDMEAVANKKGLWPWQSVAASLGGGGDVGRGLSPAGRLLLRGALERNHVPLLESGSILEAVREHVALYDSVALARGKPIRLYVNVGGGLVSVGGAQNARLIPAGLTRHLAPRSYPNRGVINVLAERGMPVIHLLQVEKLAREYGIWDPSDQTARPGNGLLFVKYKYNLWIVGSVCAAVFAANLFVLRMDLRHKLMGQPHPEGVPRS